MTLPQFHFLQGMRLTTMNNTINQFSLKMKTGVIPFTLKIPGIIDKANSLFRKHLFSYFNCIRNILITPNFEKIQFFNFFHTFFRLHI
jgi:hypothetical protein